MGSAIASALLDRGYPVTVWNRSTDKVESLVAQGAIQAESPAEAAQSASVLVICLLSYQVVRDVLGGIPNLSCCTVIDLSSGTPRQVENTAGVVNEALGASRYLHGWIMSNPLEVRAHRAPIHCSGPEDAFEQHKHVFEALGNPSWRSEDPKRAALIENGALTFVAGLFAGFLQSLALFKQGDMDQVLFTKEVIFPVMEEFQTWLPQLAQQDKESSYRGDIGGRSILLSSTIVNNATETAIDSGIFKQTLHQFGGLLEEGILAGRGSEDVSAVIEMMRSQSH